MIFSLPLIGMLLFIALSFLLWLKWRMKASKAKFALTVVSSIVLCFVFGLSSMSSTLPAAILSKFSEALGYGPITTSAPSVITFITTLIAIFFIYKFGVKAIKNWEAPPRVSELELEERCLNNNVAALSMEQIKLLLKRQSDPIASDAASNWKEKLAETPKPIERKDLLRDMLVSALSELRLPDDGWRNEDKIWVGEILGLTKEQRKKVIVLILDDVKDVININTRVNNVQLRHGTLENYRVFAIYLSLKDADCNVKELCVNGVKVEIYSSRQLILMGLDLHNYARELVIAFENTLVGGTSATLQDSFVDLNITTNVDGSHSIPFDESFKNWLDRYSNGHVAVTGEYGQGKSTVLMKYCVDWAKKFLATGNIEERVPLLIELRGQSPCESDPLTFISSWCTRYRLLPQQVMNLIKSGEAVVIFEGFDELRNAGREFYRHQHFNALWKFAYPNTKLVFTGRPNFFLDEEEVNRTLRTQVNRGVSGESYTEVWSLKKLTTEQIEFACRSFEPDVRGGIISAIADNEDFFDIVSRPSMLPVVATIWPQIAELQLAGAQLTGADLIERYVQAVFSRKEVELERDRVRLDAPSGSRYLVLPKQVRELLTICVAWKMSGLKYKNTISRSEISDMVRETYEIIVTLSKAEGVSTDVAHGVIEFEKRYSEDTLADRIEMITTEICSAGLLINDTAGGTTNLRFPHKQFFEFLVAKGIAIISDPNDYRASVVLSNSSNEKSIFTRLRNENNSINYLSECIGQDLKRVLSNFTRIYVAIEFLLILLLHKTLEVSHLISNKLTKEIGEKNELTNKYNNFFEEVSSQVIYNSSRVFIIMFSIPIFLTLIVLFGLDELKQTNILPIVSFLLPIITLHLLILLKGPERGGEVIIKLLRAHWNRAGQKPKNIKHELNLAIRSMLKGEVVFPNNKVDSDANYSLFVYPAKVFGTCKKQKG
ncbi:hypothetical protein I6F48_00980 [Pseudoalteromonas sp. SWYJ118]|uniref:NACHT domain-containing protein n=1 Tax=Pseudoalteromonas sp. SWYJ118 TaxID=2792062 RepID=UPI0018CCACFF|nr:NACHT domain-containing protein [Pseudoalteromonas sp. SWYJ118]MBH0074139.1 hypothetical protein [Pseudoalteromonas sp. SWYJ118]